MIYVRRDALYFALYWIGKAVWSGKLCHGCTALTQHEIIKIKTNFLCPEKS